MSLRIVVTRLARLDLDEMIVHIGGDNPRAAIEIAGRLLEGIELLGEQPELGRPGRRPGTRELVVSGTRYIVAYRVDRQDAQIQVLRVLHAARLWPRDL